MYSPVQGLFRLPGGFLDLGSPVTPAPSSSLAPVLSLCLRRFAPVRLRQECALRIVLVKVRDLNNCVTIMLAVTLEG
jgi:hypothetical protein